MRRLVVSLVAAGALVAGCGGSGEDAPSPAPATTGATKAQLAQREKLVDEIRRGEYKCYCHAAERARERIEKGLVEAP